MLSRIFCTIKPTHDYDSHVNVNLKQHLHYDRQIGIISVHLINQLTKFLLNDGVISETDSAVVYTTKSSFVQKLLYRLQIGIAPSDIRLSNSQHIDGGLIQLDKCSIVYLSEPKELHHLPGFRGHTIDTTK